MHLKDSIEKKLFSMDSISGGVPHHVPNTTSGLRKPLSNQSSNQSTPDKRLGSKQRSDGSENQVVDQKQTPVQQTATTRRLADVEQHSVGLPVSPPLSFGSASENSGSPKSARSNVSEMRARFMLEKKQKTRPIPIEGRIDQGAENAFLGEKRDLYTVGVSTCVACIITTNQGGQLFFAHLDQPEHDGSGGEIPDIFKRLTTNETVSIIGGSPPGHRHFQALADKALGMGAQVHQYPGNNHVLDVAFMEDKVWVGSLSENKQNIIATKVFKH